MFENLRRRSTRSTSLLDIISEVRRRWRFKLLMRGVVCVAGIGFALLLLAAYGMESARFSPTSILAGRVALGVALLASLAWFLWRPLRRRVTDEQVALYLEEHEPSLQETLVSAVEASRSGNPESAALVQRVVQQAIERCATLDAPRRVERMPMRRYTTALGLVAGVALLAVLFGPGFIRNGMTALFMLAPDIQAAAPYRIDVKPGSVNVGRGADQLISATLQGFSAEDAVIMARRGPTGEFEAMPLVPTEKGTHDGMLFDVTAPVEYYVEADGVTSPKFTLTVVDEPFVERMEIEYHFPAYTGLEPQMFEDGGDIAAIRGTEIRLRIHSTMKTPGGRLALNDKEHLPLELQPDGTLTGKFTVDGDGFYHVELVAPTGRHVASSTQYTIDVLADQPPAVSFRRPGRDTNVSPIEEVFIEAQAEDDFGVRNLELVYSVNGGAEKVVKLFEGKTRLQEVTAGHTLYLEELGLQVGDSVSYFARATDNDAAGGAKGATSDLYFLSIRPFTRDFRQAQSQGGGGGGGGGGGNQMTALSEQQKEILSATHNINRDRKTLGADKLRDQSGIVARSQAKLREQVETMITRMNSELVQRDPAMQKIGEMLP